MDCYLVLRGIKTLAVRMERHAASALELATRLERAPGVARVHYPGLASHPQHALARRQMKAPGGMISVDLAGNLVTRAFIRTLGVPHPKRTIYECVAGVNPFSAPILRPVATTLLALGVILLGIVAYTQMPIAALPSVDRPT
jgi:hypothetical protein